MKVKVKILKEQGFTDPGTYLGHSWLKLGDIVEATIRPDGQLAIWCEPANCYWLLDPDDDEILVLEEGKFTVLVKTTVGSWTTHSKWACRKEAQDQADMVGGRVKEEEDA